MLEVITGLCDSVQCKQVLITSFKTCSTSFDFSLGLTL